MVQMMFARTSSGVHSGSRRCIDLLLVASCLVAGQVDAFTVLRPQGRASAALNLVPDQGPQLVAASCAFLANKAVKKTEGEGGRQGTIDGYGTCAHDELEDTSGVAFTPTNAARAFISRIFSRKSYEGKDSADNSPLKVKPEDDIAYYPVCGFRWVAVDGKAKDDVSYKVLPTEATVSCPLRKKEDFEVLVGWYNEACFLGTSDDYWDYCQKREGQFD